MRLPTAQRAGDYTLAEVGVFSQVALREFTWEFTGASNWAGSGTENEVYIQEGTGLSARTGTKNLPALVLKVQLRQEQDRGGGGVFGDEKG